MLSSIAPLTPATAATPSLRPEVRRDIVAEQSLTNDALRRLDVAPSIDPSNAKLARQSGYAGVPVGTQVRSESSDRVSTPWTVVGASNGKLEVMRDANGKLERTSAPFASFAEYSQELMQTPATLDGRTGAALIVEYTKLARAAKAAGKPGPVFDRSTVPHLWVPDPASADEVAAKGRAARVTMVNVTEARDAERRAKGLPPSTFETTWDDVLKVRNASATKAVVLEPDDVQDAIALRRLVGDERMVTSGTGKFDSTGRERLIGTNSQPGQGKAVLDEAQKTVEWFHAKAGVDVLPKGQLLVMHENNPEYLANASAGGHGGVTNINEGPHDENLRQKWLHDLSGKRGQATRNVNKLIQKNQDTVLNHEWGHALRGIVWGEVFPNVQRVEDLTPQQLNQYFEHAMVNEAMSDLYGVARSGKPDMGIRKVHANDRFSANYEQYRAMLEASPVDNKLDEHYGTQLISKPALEIMKVHGGDALADVTGAADMSIAKMFKESEIDVVTAPIAANALYEAAARRFGADDAGVVAMRDAYAKLKVPLDPLQGATK